jgi:hypothetical protein
VTSAELIFAAVVFLVGIPAAFRNATAAMLVVAYFVVQFMYAMTGEPLQVRELLAVDFAIIATIYAKPDIPHPFCREGVRYRSLSCHLAAFWLEKSTWDRIVLGCFPLMWWAYFFAPSPHVQWWVLWGASLAQFLAAGSESLTKHISTREAKRGRSDVPETPPGAEFANAGSV